MVLQLRKAVSVREGGCRVTLTAAVEEIRITRKMRCFTPAQEHLDAENDIEAAALKARILEDDIGNASITAPSFKNPCVEQKSSMAEQKETFPPAATRRITYSKIYLFQLNTRC